MYHNRWSWHNPIETALKQLQSILPCHQLVQNVCLRALRWKNDFCRLPKHEDQRWDYCPEWHPRVVICLETTTEEDAMLTELIAGKVLRRWRVPSSKASELAAFKDKTRHGVKWDIHCSIWLLQLWQYFWRGPGKAEYRRHTAAKKYMIWNYLYCIESAVLLLYTVGCQCSSAESWSSQEKDRR